jgi:hypothetical protein
MQCNVIWAGGSEGALDHNSSGDDQIYESIFFPDYSTDGVTGNICLVYCPEQQPGLISRRVQFYFQRQFHSLSSGDVITFVRDGTLIFS